MNSRAATVAVLCLLGAASGGCNWVANIVEPDVVVLSSPKLLREQVLGSYQRIGDEVFALAGVRGVDPMTGEVEPAEPMTESRRRALEARRSMEFHRDDLLGFRRAGYVGEGNDGRLHYFDEQREELARTDPWLGDLVRELTEIENANREVLVGRIIETTPAMQGEDGARTVWAILADRYRTEADDGMWVQLPDGRWAVKGVEGERGREAA